MSDRAELIDVRSATGRKVFSTNASVSAFTAPTERTSRPSGSGFFELQGTGNTAKDVIPSALMVQPWGVGADNSTFNLRFWGYRELGGTYQPVLLAEVSCTLCAITGATGGTLGTGSRYVDTISITYGNSNVGIEAISPANDLPTHLVLVTKGVPIVWFDVGTGTATSVNASVWEL